MAKRNFACEFEGLDNLTRRIANAGGNIKAVTNEALQKTHDYITPKIHSEMTSHHNTGRTDASVVDRPDIVWEGDVASVKIGFNIKGGGLASIFLMYGTPRMKKDQKLYNDIYGRQTINAVREIQSEVFFNAVRRLNG